ncbi:ATP-binding cassette domain-containing protein [Devosia epidermidihirudinis]|uniref:ATP-binding cassette domain-containing protein n=1 Tax=Devosia epidermidihirudinis TaxID=1293439 RepID=UPI000697228A|nr:ABC transporter ATP-binding protein [Devosia epidermidihirudinis]
MAVLEIDSLTIRYGGATTPAVNDVTLAIAPGEVYALVGESGSGKTTLAKSIARLLPQSADYATGKITLAGEDVLGATPAKLRALRARELAYVFQNPITSLDPTMRVGKQLGLLLGGAPERVHAALDAVRIADPASVASRFPHQLSGGMAQRVGVAMALARRPKLLIVDEPTSALDASLTAEILALLIERRASDGTAILLLSHDLRSIAKIADRVGVMYRGALVEQGVTAAVFAAPEHEYSRRLLKLDHRDVPSAPTITADQQVPVAAELARVSVAFAGRGRTPARLALRDIDLTIRQGEVLAVVGESGSGKTTLARLLLGTLRPTSGTARIQGIAANKVRPGSVAVVLQNADWALNPRLRVASSLLEPLGRGRKLGKAERLAKARQAMEAVGLAPDLLTRYPGELSGGQRQRVSIARALIADPGFIVLDEPLSALDADTQNQVLEVLRETQTRRGYAALFITHDLSATRNFAHRIVVLYAGSVVEIVEGSALTAQARHPYSQLLAKAANGDLAPTAPMAAIPQTGCAFAPRCPLAIDRCRVEEPVLRPMTTGGVACHRVHAA